MTDFDWTPTATGLQHPNGCRLDYSQYDYDVSGSSDQDASAAELDRLAGLQLPEESRMVVELVADEQSMEFLGALVHAPDTDIWIVTRVLGGQGTALTVSLQCPAAIDFTNEEFYDELSMFSVLNVTRHNF